MYFFKGQNSLPAQKGRGKTPFHRISFSGLQVTVEITLQKLQLDARIVPSTFLAISWAASDQAPSGMENLRLLRQPTLFRQLKAFLIWRQICLPATYTHCSQLCPWRAHSKCEVDREQVELCGPDWEQSCSQRRKRKTILELQVWGPYENDDSKAVAGSR